MVNWFKPDIWKQATDAQLRVIMSDYEQCPLSLKMAANEEYNRRHGKQQHSRNSRNYLKIARKNAR